MKVWPYYISEIKRNISAIMLIADVEAKKDEKDLISLSKIRLFRLAI